MRYTYLPNTSLKISKICLGTMTFGEQNTEAEANYQMSYALDNGVNFFDTAELYSIPARKETYGDTERIIGRWIRDTGNRSKIVLASKIAGKAESNTHIRQNGFSPKALKEALEGSLHRLQTDYIDLYQLHWPIRQANRFGKRDYKHNDTAEVDNFLEILQTLDGFIKKGKIRYVGLSNDTPWGVMKYLSEGQKHGLPRMATIQNPYSLLNRTFEQGLSEVSIREQLPLLAYSPLGFGILTGKYRQGNKPEKARLTLYPKMKRYSKEQSYIATEKYYQIAKKNKLSLAQMALAFVNDRPFMGSNIIGATTISQLKENIESINLRLSEEVIKEINNIHDSIPNPAP